MHHMLRVMVYQEVVSRASTGKWKSTAIDLAWKLAMDKQIGKLKICCPGCFVVALRFDLPWRMEGKGCGSQYEFR